MMAYQEACTVISNYQLEHNINTWVKAFIRMVDKKNLTAEQQAAVKVVQAEFDRINAAK